jgi:glycosyltransferase involved in cell wall biosynthesis
MKEIVILAYHFPPLTAVGRKRPLRLANFLASRGVKVTVYAGSPRSHDYSLIANPALLGEIHPGVKVVRTQSIHLFQMAIRLRNSLRRKPAPQAGVAAEPSRPSRPPGRLVAAVDSLMSAFRVPDAYLGWVLTTFPVLLLRHLAARPAALFATGPPWSTHVLASLAGRALRIPYFVDYRDPWNLNPDYWARDTAFSKFLERFSLAKAAGVIATTSSLAEELRIRYAFPGTVHCVPNGIDVAFRAQLDALRAQGVGPDPSRFVVSHVGTLYWQRMPPLFADTLARAAAAWQGPREIRFRFLGSIENPAPLLEAFARHGVRDRLELAGEVENSLAVRELLRADVLLLLQSGYRFQVPAKLFEYVLADKPLYCLLEPDSELFRLVKGYSLGRIAGDAGDVDGMLGFLKDCRDGSVSHSDATRFFGDFDGDRLSAEIQRILGLPSVGNRSGRDGT